MPNERFYAIRNTREFLVELMDPKKTPKVPKEIRLKAYYAIKHFPGEYPHGRGTKTCTICIRRMGCRNQ